MEKKVKIVDSWIQESWKHVMSLTIVWHSGQNFHKTIWSSSSGLVMLSFRSCMISVMLVLPETVIQYSCWMCLHLKRFLEDFFKKSQTVAHCKFLPHENYGNWELRGSLQGKPALSMEKGCKNHKETLYFSKGKLCML